MKILFMGLPGAGKTYLAERVSEETGGWLGIMLTQLEPWLKTGTSVTKDGFANLNVCAPLLTLRSQIIDL